jgi:hypothetical protein
MDRQDELSRETCASNGLAHLRHRVVAAVSRAEKTALLVERDSLKVQIAIVRRQIENLERQADRLLADAAPEKASLKTAA